MRHCVVMGYPVQVLENKNTVKQYHTCCLNVCCLISPKSCCKSLVSLQKRHKNILHYKQSISINTHSDEKTLL